MRTAGGVGFLGGRVAGGGRWIEVARDSDFLVGGRRGPTNWVFERAIRSASARWVGVKSAARMGEVRMSRAMRGRMGVLSTGIR